MSLADRLKELGGEWAKVVGQDDDGVVTSIQIVALGVTAQDFARVVEEFEATFDA